jgi:hypothetical protein
MSPGLTPAASLEMSPAVEEAEMQNEFHQLRLLTNARTHGDLDTQI